MLKHVLLPTRVAAASGRAICCPPPTYKAPLRTPATPHMHTVWLSIAPHGQATRCRPSVQWMQPPSSESLWACWPWPQHHDSGPELMKARVDHQTTGVCVLARAMQPAARQTHTQQTKNRNSTPHNRPRRTVTALMLLVPSSNHTPSAGGIAGKIIIYGTVHSAAARHNTLST